MPEVERPDMFLQPCCTVYKSRGGFDCRTRLSFLFDLIKERIYLYAFFVKPLSKEIASKYHKKKSLSYFLSFIPKRGLPDRSGNRRKCLYRSGQAARGFIADGAVCLSDRPHEGGAGPAGLPQGYQYSVNGQVRRAGRWIR
jgi:hypothetical protein